MKRDYWHHPAMGDAALPSLSHDEVLRYSRHLMLPEVGVDGQRKLKAARVLLVGAGGLGSPLALYLAAAGVGTLGMVEFDAVDVSNLQRQILHGSSAIGRPKLKSAKARLKDLNPYVHFEPIADKLTSANALEIVRAFDIVADGSDNFPTRYLVNDACALAGKPYAYGAILRFEGQASVFDAARGPCYRCLFSEPPPPELVPSCADAGVLGVLPGIIGSIQALEILKFILGVGESLLGRLVVFDALGMRFRELALKKDPACPMCGPEPTITALMDYEAFCGVASAPANVSPEVSVRALAGELENGRPVLLLDVREPREWDLVHLADATLIPLGQLPSRLAELDNHPDIVAYCHTGVRSLRAVQLLLSAGFRRARSLAGGIDAWSREVDRTMPRY